MTKIGARSVTDSLTPLKFKITRRTIRNPTKINLYFWKGKGRKLNMASPQETRETVIVNI
jgi:hypothetical protein